MAAFSLTAGLDYHLQPLRASELVQSACLTLGGAWQLGGGGEGGKLGVMKAMEACLLIIAEVSHLLLESPKLGAGKWRYSLIPDIIPVFFENLVEVLDRIVDEYVEALETCHDGLVLKGMEERS